MSTQASPLPESPEFQIHNHKSLLDEPWKVTLIPAESPVGEDPHAAKSPTKSPRSRVIAT